MMLTAAVALGITLTGFGETVTNVRGAQRPNSNLVDIYYDLNASDGGTYTVEVAIEGRTDTVTATTFSGDVGKGIAPGKNRHIVWEAGADWRGKKGDVKAVVTATFEVPKGKPKKVRLWAGGPYWADRNIGADNPWDYGLYFWWGDTVGHRLGEETFAINRSNCPTTANNTIFDGQLYSEGWITATSVLVPSHDAAHVKWGGGWRMPTKQDFQNLTNKCDCIWNTVNGVKGYIVRGRGDYASNSIFLPAAGYVTDASYQQSTKYGYCGCYWSSVPRGPVGGFTTYSFGLVFNVYSANIGVRTVPRYFGASVRPVHGF